MIPKIKTVKALDDYILHIVFDDGKIVLYDVKEDIDTIPVFKMLETTPSLWPNVSIDASRTCIYWNDQIDLPSDTLYEYGQTEDHVGKVAEPAPTYNGKSLEEL
jgi:hypothetical protein